MEYSIEELIPQRMPFLMVGELLDVADGSGTSSFEVKADNILVDEGLLTEAGIIENMAQTAAAIAGYYHLKGGADCPPVGMIGELRDFVLHARPKAGDRILTTVTKGISVGNITTVHAATRVDGEVMAESSLKIAL